MEKEFFHVRIWCKRDKSNHSARFKFDVDDEPDSLEVLLGEVIIFLDIAEENEAKYLVCEDETYNFADAENGKIVAAFRLIFPSEKNLDKTIKTFKEMN